MLVVRIFDSGCWMFDIDVVICKFVIGDWLLVNGDWMFDMGI